MVTQEESWHRAWHWEVPHTLLRGFHPHCGRPIQAGVGVQAVQWAPGWAPGGAYLSLQGEALGQAPLGGNL